MELVLSEAQQELFSRILSGLGTPGGEHRQPGYFSTALERAEWNNLYQGGLAGLAALQDSEDGVLPVSDLLAIMQAIGHAAGTRKAPLAIACHLAGVLYPLWLMGTAQQREFLVPRLRSGEWFGAPAIDGGPFDAGISVTASASGAVLSGRQRVASFGLKPDIVIMAIQSDEVPGGETLVALQPGIHQGIMWRSAGENAAPGSDLIELEACQLDQATIVSGCRDHPGLARQVYYLSLQAIRLGMLQRLLARAVEEARLFTRRMKLKGRPGAFYQMLTHTVADFAVRCDAAELLLYRSAWGIERGERSALPALLAALNIDTGLMPYASTVTGLQRDYGLGPHEDWAALLTVVSAVGGLGCSSALLTGRAGNELGSVAKPW